MLWPKRCVEESEAPAISKHFAQERFEGAREEDMIVILLDIEDAGSLPLFQNQDKCVLRFPSFCLAQLS